MTADTVFLSIKVDRDDNGIFWLVEIVAAESFPDEDAMSPTQTPHSDSLAAAIVRVEQAQVACDEARAALHADAPAAEFDFAWQEYERRRAGFDFAYAEAQAILEDAQAAIP